MDLRLIRSHADDLPAAAAPPAQASKPKLQAALAALDLLLGLSDALAAQVDVQSLLQTLKDSAGGIIGFDTVSVMLHDDSKDLMRGYAATKTLPTSFRPGKEYALNDCPQGTVWRTQEPILINDLGQDRRFVHSERLVMESALQSYWVLPLTTTPHALGAVAFGSQQKNAFEAGDTEAVLKLARIVAVSVEAAENAAKCAALLARAEQQRELGQKLVAARGLDALLRMTSASLHRWVAHDAMSLKLFDPGTGDTQTVSLDEGMDGAAIDRFVDSASTGPAFSQLLATRAPFATAQLEAADFPGDASVARVLGRGFVSVCSVPIQTPERVIGVLSVGRRQRRAFVADEIELLAQTASQLVLAIEHAQALDEIRAMKARLAEAQGERAEAVRSAPQIDGIIGHSAAMRQLLAQLSLVAPSDSTVLIEGETGTGKELIARAIHERSRRRERPLITVNCAAIPPGLIESELFGHEKGAFTGAVAQRRGKFELASGGTIFLDEIGDMPREMQVKLLRVLQEREIERVGGSKTIPVDVRVIAATHVDLRQRVSAHEFRADLYYRLAVFPLRLPPLRERRGDIGPLVNGFMQCFARRMGKNIESVPADAIRALESHAWPGNIRELENLIERAVILSPGPTLEIPLAELLSAAQAPPASQAADGLEAVERAHMLRVLAECKWVLSGPRGAATRLGLKRTTLQSRMERLGIARPS